MSIPYATQLFDGTPEANGYLLPRYCLSFSTHNEKSTNFLCPWFAAAVTARTWTSYVVRSLMAAKGDERG
jgi:hypothetical protein